MRELQLEVHEVVQEIEVLPALVPRPQSLCGAAWSSATDLLRGGGDVLTSNVLVRWAARAAWRGGHQGGTLTLTRGSQPGQPGRLLL